MRRAAHLAARTLVVGLLLAAAADLPLPAGARPRRRLHLVDRSESVLAGPASSRRPQDADATIAFDRDRRAAGDEVLLASFAGDLRFESPLVDEPGRTDLRGALEGALARDPTEIVLHSDGRGDPGPALLLCRARGVPVHVMPLGTAEPRDIRFVRVRAPGDAAPGERFPVEVTVESTWDVKARVKLGDEIREIELASRVPATLVFRDRQAGVHPLSILNDDDAPQNNALRLDVLPRSAKRRVVAVPGTGLPDLKDVDLARGYVPLTGVHAVVVDGPVPSKEQRDAIAAYVREGGGLILTGGRESFVPWAGTSLEEVSPLRALPDHRVAVVFAVDCSGSMKDHLGKVVEAVLETKDLFGADDRLYPMPFSRSARFLRDWSQLPRETADGDTNFVNALAEAGKQLAQDQAGRKHVLLFTDGISAEKETPEDRRRAAKELGVGLTVITIDRELEIGTNIKLQKIDQLAAELMRLFRGIREVWREKPGPLHFAPHPFTDGLAAIEPAGMNLSSPKPAAQVVAGVGTASAGYPAIALGQAGFGRTAAIAFEPDAALLARAVAQVARPAAGAYRLSVEPPLVRARGPGTSPRLLARMKGVEFDLLQVRSALWEGRMPSTPPGTVLVELADGSSAAAVLPCLPEFEKLGVDLDALARIAAETGGRLLKDSADLARLPPPAAGGRRSGRAWFLLAALAALFAELGIATFWKAR